jgi:predicted enzyme related to lactoylglutathione lyase
VTRLAAGTVRLFVGEFAPAVAFYRDVFGPPKRQDRGGTVVTCEAPAGNELQRVPYPGGCRSGDAAAPTGDPACRRSPF